MDATFFREPAIQYEMKYVDRELIKAFASFRPRKTKIKAESLFGIATGAWGCGVFNGDKQLKGMNEVVLQNFHAEHLCFLAIIQLIAASEAERPLIYAAYLDKNFVNSFAEVYQYLKAQRARVCDLYRCVEQYSTQHTRRPLFDYILHTSTLSSKV